MKNTITIFLEKFHPITGYPNVKRTDEIHYLRTKRYGKKNRDLIPML